MSNNEAVAWGGSVEKRDFSAVLMLFGGKLSNITQSNPHLNLEVFSYIIWNVC